MKRLCVLAGLVLVAQIGVCGLVVDFNPQDLVNAVLTNTVPIETAKTRTFAFSDTTALLPGNAANGAKIYGGVLHSNSVAIGASTVQISSANDRLQTAVGASAGQTGTDKTILLWNKADFINGGSTSQLGFDNTAGSQLSIRTYGFIATPSLSRFVLKDGGTYYISDVNVTLSAAATEAAGTTVTLSGTAPGQWATFDPTNLNFTPTSVFSAQTFTNVTAVGLAYNVSRVNNPTRLYITDFTAELVTIPEPATIGMLGLGGLVAMLLRRCRG